MADNQAIEPVVSEVDVANLFYPKADAEPVEPTDEAEDATPVETKAEEEAKAEPDAEDETEESESKEEEASKTDEETLYLDLDGEEFSLEEIKQWKAGHMMQADYTRKTQEVATDREALTKDQKAFEGEKTKVTDLSAQLEALVAEDDEVDLKELREYDPDAYIKHKEKMDSRKAKLAEIKAAKPEVNVLSKDELVAESNALFAANKDWTKDGELTNAYKDDMKMVTEYASKEGYSNDELQNLTYSHHWLTLLKAARFDAQKSKGSALKKKVKLAPLVTRPTTGGKKSAKSDGDIFFDKTD